MNSHLKNHQSKRAKLHFLSLAAEKLVFDIKMQRYFRAHTTFSCSLVWKPDGATPQTQTQGKQKTRQFFKIHL